MRENEKNRRKNIFIDATQNTIAIYNFKKSGGNFYKKYLILIDEFNYYYTIILERKKIF